ncbi:hypothetical protein PV366_01140 [Streptomyces ipomoeae]|uniref:hypothetical protein n=1 Tax=Streptomyces ipomoeae TaxID=103232 RepID=UPI0006629BF2|nr:hypothetical protein [Streptomyces ipomoeae]MDX2872355.1 hypothetical protein [Streptomyces ipomoeae]
MAARVLPGMPHAKKLVVLSASAPGDRCTVSRILIQPARTTSPIRSSPCASVAASAAYPCTCIRSVSGRAEISCA